MYGMPSLWFKEVTDKFKKGMGFLKKKKKMMPMLRAETMRTSE